ncbi:hypothetical protein CPB84DRAFT_1753246 [Gymnopilus junonius]|uniref:Uncharacterized protein n=1 Tax=Gymnopilus junonius TaxID=109634 RepID=A0A9P5N920_GYMJU|nr:hypothetical protein CPB84DRAFT_1753246 [Gymnopilus junonius]
MPSPRQQSNQEKRRVARCQYYAENLEEERRKAREHAKKRLEEETPEDCQRRKDKHREAQARYRAANRTQLCLKSWQDRKNAKWRKAQENDERELVLTLQVDEPVV